MLCDGCKKWPRLRGIKFCARCRDRALAEMEREKYIPVVDREIERVRRLIEAARNMKSQRGSR